MEHPLNIPSASRRSVLIRRINVISGIGLCLALASVARAQDAYVQTTASYFAHAGTNFLDGSANKSDTHDSGIITGNSAAASSDIGFNGIGVYIHNAPDGFPEIRSPEVDAYVESHASPGSLGGSVTLVGNSDTAGIISPLAGIYLQGNASASAKWRDVFTFETTNPNGSDYKLKLNLDSHVVGDHLYSDAFNNSQWGVNASADVNAVIDGGGYFGLVAFNSEQGDNLPGGPYGEDDKASHPYSELSYHIAPGQPVVITLTGSLNVGASLLNVDAALQAEASHTALFAISTDDPLAHYSTQSGAVFATDVPEPASASAALLLACGCLSRRTRLR